MKRRYRDTRRHREIAADYGLAKSTISNIKTGRRYKKVDQ